MAFVLGLYQDGVLASICLDHVLGCVHLFVLFALSCCLNRSRTLGSAMDNTHVSTGQAFIKCFLEAGEWGGLFGEEPAPPPKRWMVKLMAMTPMT